jgi:hypothetical protein
MKKRRKKGRSLQERFLSTCCACGKAIGSDQEVFAASARAKPGVDLSREQGQVIELQLLLPGKVVLAAVAGKDSQARRDGKDLLFMCCSARCADAINAVLQDEIDIGKQLDQG